MSGLVDRIDTLLPSWMLTAPRQAMGFLMSGLAGFLDAFAEGVVSARLAAVPGQVRLPGVAQLGGFDSCDALPLIARDRAVTQGMPGAEMPWQLAARCRSWLDDAAAQTGPFGVLQLLAALLVPTVPLLRLVVDNGTMSSWYTLELDGTLRLQRGDGCGFFLSPDGTSGVDATMAARFDWASTTLPPPPDATDHSGFFVIAYTPFTYCTANDGTTRDMGIVGDLYNAPTTKAPTGSPWAGTCGTNAPIELIEMMRSGIRTRRACGNLCKYIIVATDPASFNPDGSSAAGTSLSAYPNGTWGYPSIYQHSVGARVPSRLNTAFYWPGASGGRAP